MAGLHKGSLWSRSSPSARLAFGALLIAVVGLFGLTPKTVFGLLLAWPHAALWGAVGWGRVGLSLRPMLILVVFGVMQDVAFYAPIGSFVMVNLLIYGASAAVSDQYDVSSDPVLSWVAPGLLLFTGFFCVWLIASSVADHAVRLLPLMADFLVTLALYYVFRGAFELGRRPGDYAGQSQ